MSSFLDDIQSSELALLRIAQSQDFKSEIELLMWNKSLPARSSILSLHQFLDDYSILRVGGRLRNSSFNMGKIHPILVSPKHSLTKFILRNIHFKPVRWSTSHFWKRCSVEYINTATLRMEARSTKHSAWYFSPHQGSTATVTVLTIRPHWMSSLLLRWNYQSCVHKNLQSDDAQLLLMCVHFLYKTNCVVSFVLHKSNYLFFSYLYCHLLTGTDFESCLLRVRAMLEPHYQICY